MVEAWEGRKRIEVVDGLGGNQRHGIGPSAGGGQPAQWVRRVVMRFLPTCQPWNLVIERLSREGPRL